MAQLVSKRDQVVASFKEANLSGIIQPGESIVESKVAQQLGTDIPLAQEALIELEHQSSWRRFPTRARPRLSWNSATWRGSSARA